MNKTLSRQTIVPDCNRVLRLSGNVLSPYFQRQSRGRGNPGRDTKFISVLMARAYISDYEVDGVKIDVLFELMNAGNTAVLYTDLVSIVTSSFSDGAGWHAAALAAIQTYATTKGLTVTSSDVIFPYALLEDVTAAIAAITPASYKTIVSQTGTAAPAVGGSLSPLNRYPAGTTFTWARSSAGVYTLTASAAVFDTSGKTSVFLGSLNNLNGSWKAVVTSTTVITLTTAVQSLAVLGLLGFTATPTDGLLSATEISVNTYI